VLVPSPAGTESEDSSVANKAFGISDLASLGFGQVGQLLETMDMMSKTWSSMTLPASMSPTLSLEELDKRISDLRAIEQWLALNQNMLRGTIQGLEVQRGTIATLRSFGQAMGSAETGGAQALDPERLAALFAAVQRPAPPAGNADPATPPGQREAERAPQAATPEGGPAARQDSAQARPGNAEPAAGQADVTQLAQAWWNMLNQQFQQVAGAAMGGMAAASDASPATADASPAAGKPRAGKAGTGARKRAPRTS